MRKKFLYLLIAIFCVSGNILHAHKIYGSIISYDSVEATPVQFGIWPVQLFSFCANVYGVNMNPTIILQNNTYGISCAPLIAQDQGHYGVSTSVLGTIVYNYGLQIGGLNWNQDNYGLQIGTVNLAEDNYGVMLGIVNSLSDWDSYATPRGIQFGIFNATQKGFQFGLLNYNEKAWIRWLPFFNYS